MLTRTPVLVHLCSTAEWDVARATGERRPPSLDEVGFVHMSAPGQVHLPANRLYSGRRDMVLLRCDPTKLGAPVRWEPGVPGDPESMMFPHLYGPLPAAAVTGWAGYLPDDDGVFGDVTGQPGARSAR